MRVSSYESYPWWMVATCNSVSLAIYAIGLYLTARLGVVWSVLYAVYCLWVEWRVLSGSCPACYYFGKRCAFGKGQIAAWFVRKRDAQPFCAKQISWRDLVPDFLAPLLALGAGLVNLIWDFSWIVLWLVALLVMLGSVGTGLMRGHLACRYCRQRELGCPAEQFFNKPKPT